MMRVWMFSLLAGCLLSVTVAAQTESEQEADEDEPPATRQQSEPAPTREQSEDSPYDYRASEEISEDLSVSFPVDI